MWCQELPPETPSPSGGNFRRHGIRELREKNGTYFVPFPFSDLSRAKRRPALVTAELESEKINQSLLVETK